MHGIQDEIREVGAIPRLLELLRTRMDSSSLVVTVVKALSVLAHSNHANMETVFRLGGVPLLLEMLSPKIGPVSNAAAADLIRVLCSNELCQQNILRNQGLQVRPRRPLGDSTLLGPCRCKPPECSARSTSTQQEYTMFWPSSCSCRCSCSDGWRCESTGCMVSMG